jgi:tRNA (guanine-N7-)-methyltransferase
MANLLPRLRVDIAAPALQDDRETWLEIGFGGGEHLAHQASLHPEIDFIGAEPFINGVAKLLAFIEAKGLGNIRIHDGDVRYLLEALPAACLDRIYLLYPDPWPKVRHHKRRLVNSEALAQFHRILRPEGRFIFASDIPDYVDWTLQHVAQHGGWDSISDSDAAPEDWVETRYEAKAIKAGRKPRYLAFRRRGTDDGRNLLFPRQGPISQPT